MGDHMIGRWIMAVVMEAAGIETEVQTPETAGSTDLRDKETGLSSVSRSPSLFINHYS